MTFLWKWHMEKTLVCIASQQQDIGKIKNLILLDLKSLELLRKSGVLFIFLINGIRCPFLLTEWRLNRNLSFFTRMQKSLKGCFDNILNQKESSATYLSCDDFKWIHFIWGFFFFPNWISSSISKKKVKAIQKFVHSLISNMTNKGKGKKRQTRPCGAL